MGGLPGSGPRGLWETWRTQRGACWKGGAGRGMSGMRGRGRPGRKEEVEGRMEDASHRAPLLSPSWDAQRGQESLPASTHLADTHWVPLCVSSPGLIGTEAQRVAISLAQYCLALTPKWKRWEHRPFRDHGCTPHPSSCTYFSEHIKLCICRFLCLGCCALLHLPGDLLVVLLVPDKIPLTLKCPFKRSLGRRCNLPLLCLAFRRP